MNKIAYLGIGVVMAASLALAPFMALAQVQSTMPALYNAAGQQVNMSGSMTSPLPAGNYYLQPNQTQVVNYYGNGTYYNPSTMMYGGSVGNPTGTAGVLLNYVVPGTGVTTPTAPNTGAGGDAGATWIVLGVAGFLVVAGGVYLVYLNKSSKYVSA